jgi:hypothetical protein
MQQPKRGVIYIVWGQSCKAVLDRSIASLQRHHPGLPHHIAEINPITEPMLRHKASMLALSPFESTLFLDADTVVMGNLNHGFEQAERFGIACCICECPWMRRYGHGEGDGVEYNTGVIFFSKSAEPVFSKWQSLSQSRPAASSWTALDGKPRGLNYEDQAGFAWAIRESNFNPFVLPMNYNVRPNFHRTMFLPIKVWHDYREPPADLQSLSQLVETGKRPVTYVDLQSL